MTPLPHPAEWTGGGGGHVGREMSWLKSTEVEDKKIISRKVSPYLGFIERHLYLFYLKTQGFYDILRKCSFLFLDNSFLYLTLRLFYVLALDLLGVCIFNFVIALYHFYSLLFD